MRSPYNQWSSNSLLYSVFLFHLVFLLQLASGIILFHIKLGWTPTSISQYYLGAGDYPTPLGIITLFKVAGPHLLAMSMIVFIITHFLAFTQKSKWLSPYLWGFMFLDIFSGFFIRFLHPNFATIKLISFLGFQIFFFWAMWTILKSAVPRGQVRFLALFKNS